MKLIFGMQVIIFKLSENHSVLIQNGLQEPNTDQDKIYSQKVNEYLNNPPTPGSQQDLQSLLGNHLPWNPEEKMQLHIVCMYHINA